MRNLKPFLKVDSLAILDMTKSIAISLTFYYYYYYYCCCYFKIDFPCLFLIITLSFRNNIFRKTKRHLHVSTFQYTCLSINLHVCHNVSIYFSIPNLSISNHHLRYFIKSSLTAVITLCLRCEVSNCVTSVCIWTPVNWGTLTSPGTPRSTAQ